MSVASIAELREIWVYPIKSLDGVRCATSVLVPGGGLVHDRRWAMVDSSGSLVTGKRTAAVHSIVARYCWDPLRVRFFVSEAHGLELTAEGEVESGGAEFLLPGDLESCADWLSQRLGQRIRLVPREPHGWPDDRVASGPTLVSTETLQAVAGWWNGISADEMRVRFRPNLVVGGVPGFWEDGLLADTDEPARFQLGPADFEAVNPCRRCVVPTRDPRSGEVDSSFVQRFMERRASSLPKWSPRVRFDHFYRLTINTRFLGADMTPIECGMGVRRC